jgi:lipoprotein-releasing system ATP-binding protein
MNSRRAAAEVPMAPAAAAALEPAVSARGIRKRYVGGDGTPIQVLDGVDLDVARGEAVSVIGQSGSGKSTLLHVLGGLDKPDAGEVRLGGRLLNTLGEEGLATLRGTGVGFVFQFHHLLREFTALENVMMPQLIVGVRERDARDRARDLLASGGAGGAPGAQAGAALRRRAAAGRGGAGARQPPARAAGGRALGEPGPRDQRAAARPSLSRLPPTRARRWCW